jgi:hypothetical protein
MLATLAKDYELRLAISLKDAALAEPILGSLVAADPRSRQPRSPRFGAALDGAADR